ncbi:sulfite exporter TauE/SafE family protein [Maricaulis sp. CAU 1757]
MPLLLIAAFLITATLYASVGFGGGSTYNALLVMGEADYRIIPAVALLCNLIVASGGVWRFAGTGDLSVRRLLPFLVASIPAAWIGGRLPVSETVFVGLLGCALLVSGVHLAVQRDTAQTAAGETPRRSPPHLLAAGIGGAIGLLSGLVGIGGGIFLAPVLYVLKWGTPRQIAAASSLFILINSLSGLAGQLTKLQDMALLALAAPYWPLPLAVLVGGQVGSWLAGYRLSPTLIRRLTAILILYVAVRLISRWLGMI